MRKRVLTREVVIVNTNGLHTRPAGRIAAAARRFDADIKLECAGRSADATSIVSLLALAALCGRRVHVSATGPEAALALDALCSLIEAGFGDEFEEA